MATYDQLSDTPDDKVGQDHRYVTVKVDESGLEYTRLLDAWGESSQSGLIKAGAFVDRPAAGFPERYYLAVDVGQMFYDNGSTWQKVSVADHGNLDGRGAADHHAPSPTTTEGDMIIHGAPVDPDPDIRLPVGADGQVLRSNGTIPVWVDDDYAIELIIDGGGSAITTGQKGHVEVPAAGVIEGWTIVADQSGSIVVDVWLDSYANFPPTVADTIAGSEKPTLSSAVKNQDLALGTWTTTVAKGDWIAFNVDSITTCERVTVSLRIRKT